LHEIFLSWLRKKEENLEKQWQGDEFKHGDTAQMDWGNGNFTNCRVLSFSKQYGGWWYVQLENGTMHYTKNLIK